MLEEGKGCNIDYKKSFEMYMKSAEHNNSKALCNLGII